MLQAISPSNIIPQSGDDTTFILQFIMLGDQSCMTFYDTGADFHLIKGEIAEKAGLKIVSDRPTMVGHLGGGAMWTSYGIYTVNLGPTVDGHYFQVTAQGITKVTAPFKHYNLSNVNKEAIASNKLPKGCVLPKSVGGIDAGLLIGVRATGLCPSLLFQLPNGLGVYESAIKDKWGSLICYGGPHRCFSNANVSVKGKVNYISVYFAELVSQYRSSPYVQLNHRTAKESTEQLPGIYISSSTSVFENCKDEDIAELFTDMLLDQDSHGINLDVEEISNPCTFNIEKCCCIHICNLVQDFPSYISVYKAKVPVSKRKGYIDEEDLWQDTSPRCEDCTICPRCGSSAKARMISIQERFEQSAIERSITLNLEDKRVEVELPFVKDPVEHLKARHNGEDSNFRQASRIFKSNCNKSKEARECLIRVHQELVNKNFMCKLEDLPREHQDIIKKAPFKHYMPWNCVQKPDSASTPYRMTADASITGLNEILAKGVNTLTIIPEMLMRNRTKKLIFASDISKLYNQLHLKPSALPYGLFLFNDDLDASKPADTYVMLVAWYGVTSTGNQAAAALDMLTKSLESEFPLAREVIKKDVYVDDTLSGSNSHEIFEEQIRQTKECLSRGGFSLKFVAKSSEPLPAEASADGETMKILGYKWNSTSDVLSPGFMEVNFNKKRRGAKRPNPFPVSNSADIAKLLESLKITRRLVTAKVAEVWDPAGLWEAYKLQLKLDTRLLNGYEWDEEIDLLHQESWKSRFTELLQLPFMCAPRCIVPADAVNPDAIRIICTADASLDAGGCAIYAGFERANGSFSSDLFYSRSKLMSNSVPRNELEAIRLMADSAINVKRALVNRISEIIYVTDSTIAMCWCHNTTKRLRMFMLSRVSEIRRNILGKTFSADQDTLELYHIDGQVNPADLVTKQHDIQPSDIGEHSIWQSGYPWMTRLKKDMNLTSFKDLTVDKDVEALVDTECFPEPIMSEKSNISAHCFTAQLNHDHCCGCSQPEIFISVDICQGITDPLEHCDDCSCTPVFSSFALSAAGDSAALVKVLYFGWKKSLKIIAYAYNFIFSTKHKVHVKNGLMYDSNCKVCETDKSVTHPEKFFKLFRLESMDYWFRLESDVVAITLPISQTKNFLKRNGIFYYESRIVTEATIADLDLKDTFFDSPDILKLLPVVRAQSEMFLAILLHVHYYVRPHSGVETTMREICRSVWPVGNPRKVVQRVRKDCSYCRKMNKKTLELRMMNHPAARTTLSPPFYFCQADVVYGFRAQTFKNARKPMEAYALIICCILTGAVNILCLEGMSTRDILNAFERHAARYGLMAELFVDNGCQLIALKNASAFIKPQFTPEFEAARVNLQDSYGFKVNVSNPKSHQERGRIEARVRIMRSMLEKVQANTDTPLTYLQWETLFSKISVMINDLPIAKTSRSNVSDPLWDIITPNRLILGRNSNRTIEGWISLDKGADLEHLMRKNESILNTWYTVFSQRLHHLIPRPAKWGKTDPVNVGDSVLFLFTETPGSKPNQWKLGIIKAIPKINSVEIEYVLNPSKKGVPTKSTLLRCPRDVCIIAAANEFPLGSNLYFEQIIGELLPSE